VSRAGIVVVVVRPQYRERAIGLEHAMELSETALTVEPVKGVRDRGAPDATVADRQVLRRGTNDRRAA
jgi:hypothetical protein